MTTDKTQNTSQTPRITDKQRVGKWLEERGSITAMEALEAFGCYRLGARIFELRKAGWDIATTYETTADGERYAKYVYTEPVLF